MPDDKWCDSVEELLQSGNSDGSLVGEEYVNVVKNLGKEVLERYINNNIYGSYTPKENGWVKKGKSKKTGQEVWIRATYERRYDLTKKIFADTEDNGTVVVVSTRASVMDPISGADWDDGGDPGWSFLKLLESGNMGLWAGGKARSVIKEAQEYVDSSKFWSEVNAKLGNNQ